MLNLPIPKPHICEQVKSSAFTKNDMLKEFVKAATKQRHFGGLEHNIFCNSRGTNGNGYGRCNCGVSDILSCLAAYESVNWEERA